MLCSTAVHVSATALAAAAVSKFDTHPGFAFQELSNPPSLLSLSRLRVLFFASFCCKNSSALWETDFNFPPPHYPPFSILVCIFLLGKGGKGGLKIVRPSLGPKLPAIRRRLRNGGLVKQS